MSSPAIQDFKEGDSVEGFYAVQDANLLTTASGKPYIRFRFGDASGTIQGNMWDADAEIFNSFAVGDVVKIRAGVETYRGSPQLKITALRPAHDSEYDPAQFVPVTPADTDALRQELAAMVDSVGDPDYQALLRAFFQDEELLERFCRAPAAKSNHHAYLGGLLEHTISIARLCRAFVETSSTPMDRDLLMAGALLHDIGKIEELGIGTAIDYTDKGSLVGHLMLGTLMVERRAAAIPDFPEIKKLLVMHLILSHHGRYEYGSPVLPAVPEALALHHVDNLDAKTVAARRLIDEDAENDRAWTERSWMLETRLFKGAIGVQSPSPVPARSSPAQASDETPSAPKKKSKSDAESDAGTGTLF